MKAPSTEQSDADREPPPSEVTISLVRAARSGDRARFVDLYERMTPMLFSWASLRMRPELRARVDPEDLLQETWLRVWKGLPSFDPAQSSFRSWLIGVAQNVLYEMLRKLAGARLDERGGSGNALDGVLGDQKDRATTFTRALARDEAVRTFLEHVERLEKIDRDVLIHCGLEGRTHSEAASLIGATPDAVGKRLQRLRRRMQEGGWLHILDPDA